MANGVAFLLSFIIYSARQRGCLTLVSERRTNPVTRKEGIKLIVDGLMFQTTYSENARIFFIVCLKCQMTLKLFGEEICQRETQKGKRAIYKVSKKILLTFLKIEERALFPHHWTS